MQLAKVCLDCGKSYFNLPAHLEECTGPTPLFRLCGTRRWQQGNTWVTCQRPAGHEGGHVYG